MNMKNPSALAAEYVKAGKLERVKIIDTHTHMDGVAGVSMPTGGGIEACIKLMDEQNIESIWCSSHSDLFAPSVNVNVETERLMHAYPDRVKGYYCFNPNHKDVYLEHIGKVLTDSGYVGLKFLPNYHNHDLDGYGYDEALAFANKHELIVLSHTWGDKPQNSCKEVEEVLLRRHDLTFIIGHSAPGDLDTAIRLVYQHDNAYLDLCDIHRHSGIVEKMVNKLGSEHILFGTDMPWYDPAYCIGSVLFAKITDRDRENIFYKNAERLLQNTKKDKKQ
ncbi:MAG: amidohydrolase family protein [Spirochaetaceae bacterium]|jgi:predicted TIM-barrel fold metal-dependent hydrolase|nr:amidohydrolase family protein [Spirochaetaceae bacterium]